ncbi:efflux transporter outer membrane subunit [Haloferula sp. BvORR071]|uniref:efflux transporter outer membrane subunit n=1 Tax=Haloferula sp. BvORR071 TaxID=1396141 RepID=UPI000696AE09|nr:efflux transporter outer membrane subunit [Haloferula sp. BvORR071]
MKCTLISGSLACFAVAACALKTPPTKEDILTSIHAKVPGSFSASHGSGPIVPNWISSFNDPELTNLVNYAVARNPDLTAAAAKVEASRHAVTVASGALYPRAGIKVMGQHEGREILNDGPQITPPDLGSSGEDNSGGAPSTDRGSDNTSIRWVGGLGFGASWEADVWGRVGSKSAAAQADADAAEADYLYARQSLAAAVARAYISAIEASQQAANAREAIGLYNDYLNLTGIRKEQGHASDFEISQIKSRTAGAQDTLHAAEAARAKAIRGIEVITAQYPSGRLSTRDDFPRTPKTVPAGLPSQILERRPDLIAAERRFAASFHRVEEARTARLPRFALSAANGLGSAHLNGVGTLSSVTWTLAGGITQPIFFGGELKAMQDLRTAEQKAAAALYTSAALHAFEDVEDALANEYYLRMREEALGEMVKQSSDSVKYARMQFDQGQMDMFQILRLVGENLAAKVELTQVQASRLRERVNLHLALGGDFKGTSYK